MYLRCATAVSAMVLGLVTVPVSSASAASAMYIENVNSGLCLAIGSASKTQGVQAIQWNCESGHAEQQWTYVTDEDTITAIKNVNSGLCLAIGNGTAGNGEKVIQWNCEASANHLEQFWIHGGSTWHWKNVDTSQCMAIGSGSKVKGVGAIQWNCEGESDGTHPEQMWVTANF
ncbi:hypothetical protein WN71_032625 [Streptomyces mangrovisoli]|uniref:Ricin B lectin domain-containing protein n=2 Tax=Streptomyces mangrovisoli TaxID=1428628 RepID=A0A1J4NML4_9ACTN|nr:hypothetical protein WN71_032625 [Streptomyces mangrovisoli]